MTSLLLLPLMPEPPGPAMSTPSEIRHLADPAGLSALQRHSATDSLSPPRARPTSSSPPRTQSLAIRATSPVMVVTSTELGTTSPALVLLPMLACHTPLARAQLLHAQLNALAQAPGPNTSAKLAQLLPPEPLLESNLRSRPMDPWRPPSTYTPTS